MNKIIESKKDNVVSRMIGKEVRLSQTEDKKYYQVLVSYPYLMEKMPKVWTYKRLANAKNRYEKECEYLIK